MTDQTRRAAAGPLGRIALAGFLALAGPAAPQDAADPRHQHDEGFENPGAARDTPYPGWAKVASREHPSYNEIKVEDDRAGAASGAFYLRLTTLGGRTGLQMLPKASWRIDPTREYRFSCSVRLIGTRANRASATLTWLDARSRPILESRSTPVEESGAWTELSLKIPRVPPEAQWVAVRLDFDGTDVRGECRFDRLVLTSQPRLLIEPADRPLPIFEPGKGPRLKVSVPTLAPGEHTLQVVTRTLDGTEAARAPARRIAPPVVEILELPPHRAGYYEIHAEVSQRGRPVAARASPLIVPNPRGAPSPAPGMLGGSFNPFRIAYKDRARALAELAGFPRSRVTVWDRAEGGRDRAPEPDEIRDLMRAVSGTETYSVTAVLANLDPRRDLPELDAGELEDGPLALFRRDRRLWGPLFLDTVQRYQELVGHWQIGRDDDTRGAARPDAEAELRAARQALQALSQTARIGVPVDPERAAQLALPSAQFYSMRLRESDAALPGGDRELFASAVLPPVQGGDQAGQVAALLRRLVRLAAEGPRFVAVYLPVEPSPEGGMIDPDGNPLAPFLGVRAFNELLGGATLLKGVHFFDEPVADFVFERGGRGVVVAWHEGGEVHRQIDLGAEARLYPPLGEARALRPGEQIRLDGMPLFIENVDLTRLEDQRRLQFFESPDAAVPNNRLPLGADPTRRFLRIRNGSEKSEMTAVQVRIDEREPAGWTIRPRVAGPFTIPAGKEFSQETFFTLPAGETGESRDVVIRVSFLRDGRPGEIQVTRALQVVPLIEVTAEGHEAPGDPAGRRVTIRVFNRAKRPAALVARVRIPGLPERTEPLGVVEEGAEASRRLVYDLGAAREVTVVCEELGGDRLRVRKKFDLR